jgi:GT2 family glycosyltransferase
MATNVQDMDGAAPSPEEETPPDISIIIISYNTREMTLECLRSIRQETTVSHEIILLDNASHDGSAAAVAREFPEVQLMAQTENHGFAKGNNLAARQARGRYLLLLNPDTVVLDHAIDNLLAHAVATPQAMIWGGRTLYGDRRLKGRMTLWSILCTMLGLSSAFRDSALFNPEGYGKWPRDEEREVDIIIGAFLLIEQQFWQQLGGFDLRICACAPAAMVPGQGSRRRPRSSIMSGPRNNCAGPRSE